MASDKPDHGPWVVRSLGSPTHAAAGPARTKPEPQVTTRAQHRRSLMRMPTPEEAVAMNAARRVREAAGHKGTIAGKPLSSADHAKFTKG